jgi:HD superfamily phosphohydrolase YqeK
MISEPKTKKALKPEKSEVKEVQVVKVPFYCSDSLESDWIREKIKSNKEYLSKCTNKALYLKVEKDTLFLENHILPIILAKSNLFFNDSTKLFVQSLDKAIQSECNSMVMYLPINENYTDRPKAGVSNCKDKLTKTPLNVELRADFYLYNHDGNSSPFEYVDLLG